MAKTRLDSAAKREPLNPIGLHSLNLSQDIVLFDKRSQYSLSSSQSQPVPITRLSGAPKSPRKCRKKTDLAPRWGTIPSTTESPDEIVQLFEEWRRFQESTDQSVKIQKQTRKSYPREYKLKALTLLRVGVVIKPRRKGSMIANSSPEWERISQNHAATLLHLSPKQLRDWKRDEEKIIQSLKGSRQVQPISLAKWPEMEVELHLQFKEMRKMGRSVNHKWFERRGKAIFADLYPEQVGFREDGKVVFDCTFSNGWFTGFKQRWNISWRCKTNVASKTPEDYRPKIILFCKFNRRNSQVREGEEEEEVGRYPLGNMFNMDQTPFPFEFLTGRTYNFKGNTTIWERALRSSWGKRQATLQITICADGEKRVKPLLIFRGTGETKPFLLEALKYDSRIRAIFNPKGYSNEAVTLNWLEYDLIPSCAFPGKPRFLALDVFAGQKTATVLSAFRQSNTVTSFIPEGCTGLVQSLDTSINKTLKSKISDLLDEEMDKNRDLWEEGRFTIGDRRILMTWVVGEAWDWLHKEKKDLIIKSFRQVGISLAIDGSQDSEIKIKGLENLEVGDWKEGGLDCNLNRLGKTGAGELQWDLENDLLDPIVAEYSQNQLKDLIDGEYVDSDDLLEENTAGIK